MFILRIKCGPLLIILEVKKLIKQTLESGSAVPLVRGVCALIHLTLILGETNVQVSFCPFGRALGTRVLLEQKELVGLRIVEEMSYELPQREEEHLFPSVPDNRLHVHCCSRCKW